MHRPLHSIKRLAVYKYTFVKKEKKTSCFQKFEKKKKYTQIKADYDIYGPILVISSNKD